MAKTWKPLGDGSYHTDGPELIHVNGARLEILRSDWADLQQGYALCILTEAEPTIPATKELVDALEWVIENDVLPQWDMDKAVAAALAAVKNQETQADER